MPARLLGYTLSYLPTSTGKFRVFVALPVSQRVLVDPVSICSHIRAVANVRYVPMPLDAPD